MKRSGFKRKAPSKVKKTSTITQLKKKLWDECRRIIRARYNNVCYTCYKPGLEGGNWQTGHFIPSSICSAEMRYDLDNLRPQCYHCNINLSGNWPEFEKHLKAEMGDDFPDKLKQRNQETKGRQYDRLWYEAKLEEYRNCG